MAVAPVSLAVCVQCGSSGTGARDGSSLASGSGSGTSSSSGPGSGASSTSGGPSNSGSSGGSGGSPASGGSSNADAGDADGGSGSDANTGEGGSSASTIGASYTIGADVSDQEPQPDATRANLLSFMKSHGFNYVRLRTFVDPGAADGYDRAKGFDDIAHTVAFGKQVKDAGMGLLVDFHYSDNWADPGKQCVPVAWQTYTTIAGMAAAVHDYTKSSITQLIAGGARPDMVQIGNEETPGILIHLCDSGGLPKAGTAGYNPVNGAIYLYSSTDKGPPPAGGPAAGGWSNLGMLLNAAVRGVKDVDAGIKIALHVDRCNDTASSQAYMTNAKAQGVAFDVFGESCYVGTQGQPSAMQTTIASIASSFPSVKFMAAEYGGSPRAINDIFFDLAHQQGAGTFNWQPTTLWVRSGSTYAAGPDMPIYDQMRIDYASRL
ncbi:MAG TPA: glycosyl hydrolase 53 family protein [Polyangiaceae bacterium]|nr:glycosyl hydrolase 53 family protein [Polyangiaceae bacterium]